MGLGSCQPEERNPVPDQFAQDARSLVGKTRSAQKRMLAAEAWRQLDKHPYLAGVRGGSSDEQAAAMYRRWVARAIRSYILTSASVSSPAADAPAAASGHYARRSPSGSSVAGCPRPRKTATIPSSLSRSCSCSTS